MSPAAHFTRGLSIQRELERVRRGAPGVRVLQAPGGLERRGETVSIPRPKVALAPIAERGRAFGAAVVGAGCVPPHTFPVPAFCPRPREFFNIEADARRITNKVFELELLMILEEPVVHLPELPLG